MKKLLSILSAVCIVAATAVTVLSCISSQWEKDLKAALQYTYQTGPSKIDKDGTNLSNEFLTSINVGSYDSYSTYNTKDQHHIFDTDFNGNLDNVLRTRDDNFKLNAWKNDTASFQNILYFKKDKNKYKNISVSLSDSTDKLDDSQKALGNMKFEKYILSVPYKSGSLNNTVPERRQYIPDAPYLSNMDSLEEKINDKYSHKEGSVVFPLWNVWGEIKTSSSTKQGLHNMNIHISFDYGNQHKEYDKKLDLFVSDRTLNKDMQSMKYDYNRDGKNDSNDNFGFNAETFPKHGLNYWYETRYKGIPDFSTSAKVGATSWTKDIPDDLKNKSISVKQAYKSINSSDINCDASNGKFSFSLSNVGSPFVALYEIYSDNKLVSTCSVYYTETGELPSDNLLQTEDYASDYGRSARKMKDREEMTNPLSDSKAQFIFGSTNYQYIGKLVDKSYKNTSDYERALREANKNPSSAAKFMRNTDDHKWTWTFDFHQLDKEMRLAAKENIPQVVIDPVDNSGFSFKYLRGDNDSEGKYSGLMEKYTNASPTDKGIENNDLGTPNVAAKPYIDNVLSEFSKQLSEHLKSLYSNEAYKTKDGETVKIYIDSDEINESLVTEALKTVRANCVKTADGEIDPEGRIYWSAYYGWRSNAAENYGLDSAQMNEDLNGEDSADQFILTYFAVAKKKDPNKKLATLRKFIDKRNESGRRTMFYNVNEDFPGNYLQSDLSDPYWQLFFAYNMHTGGWAKWAYDWLLDDYLGNGSDNEGVSWPDMLPSGESVYTYGGDDINGAYSSKRFLGVINAVNYVYKIIDLLNDQSLNETEKKKLVDATNSIGVSVQNRNANNDYKWNVTTAVPSSFNKLEDAASVPTSLQVAKLIALINSIE